MISYADCLHYGHNLHEMSNPDLWENKKNINFLSAKYPPRVVKVKKTMLHMKENYHLPLLPKTHINATVCPRGYLTRWGKYLPLGVNIPLGVNLMHINRVLDQLLVFILKSYMCANNIGSCVTVWMSSRTRDFAVRIFNNLSVCQLFTCLVQVQNTFKGGNFHFFTLISAQDSNLIGTTQPPQCDIFERKRTINMYHYKNMTIQYNGLFMSLKTTIFKQNKTKKK